MLCPKCSRENPGSASYCAHCGEPLAQPAPPGPPPLRPRISGLAVASLILGILGGLVITAVVGLVFGIVALTRINRSQGRLRGQGLAIAGIVISGVALLFLPLIAAMVFPVFARARESARGASCLGNVKNVTVAIQMYMSDWDERPPQAANWCDDLWDYLMNDDVFRCPAVENLDCGFAYNSDLSEAGFAYFYNPRDTIAIFESDQGWNAAGPPEDLLPFEPRHLEGDNFGYLDGHAEWQPRGLSGDYAPEEPAFFTE